MKQLGMVSALQVILLVAAAAKGMIMRSTDVTLFRVYHCYSNKSKEKNSMMLFAVMNITM